MRAVPVLLLATGMLASAPALPPPDEGEIRGALAFLTAPELRGRRSGSPESEAVPAWLLSRFAALGIPAVTQEVPAVAALPDPAGTGLTILPAPGPVEGAVLPLDAAEPVDVEGPLVHAGHGIGPDWDGVFARGAVVWVFSGAPAGMPPSRESLVSAKRARAAGLGAVALVVVPAPGSPATAAALAGAGLPSPDRPFVGAAGIPPGIPVAYAPREALAAAGPGARARVRIGVASRRDLVLRNVVARVGPEDAAEAVVLGAHWDGRGIVDGAVQPGADDNASGIGALLAVAADLAARPPSGRAVLLAAWAGEEEGRLGSRRFVAAPLRPVAVAVNLDMLGRNNLDREDHAGVIQVIYSAGAPVLRELATAANARAGFDLRFHPALRFVPVSDHASFAEAGVPIVYPFSGYHADYHGPGDAAEKVLVARVARGARYAADLARALAAHPGPIRIDPAITTAPPPDPFERPRWAGGGS